MARSRVTCKDCPAVGLSCRGSDDKEAVSCIPGQRSWKEAVPYDNGPYKQAYKREKRRIATGYDWRVQAFFSSFCIAASVSYRVTCVAGLRLAAFEPAAHDLDSLLGSKSPGSRSPAVLVYQKYKSNRENHL